ncbi:MAG: ATP-binding cassette domain-containing protein [Magnetococcales bacterium]|nr:ATP-binding cassette domain-containing protein [Magnetococcales bacterium]
MDLITLRGVSLGFGAADLLDKVDFRISQGERVAMIGRNGTGKTTFMRLITGETLPDQGSIHRSPGLRVGYLVQEVPEDLTGSVMTVVSDGLGEIGALLSEYHAIGKQLSETSNEVLLSALEEVQHQLDTVDGWKIQQQVETTLSRLELNADMAFESLSGGLKRRVLLAQALVRQPDLLLLDEPTNHLDIEAIQWLENFLITDRCALLFVTHDRFFLQNVATRIIELDRGQLTDWPGDYNAYLKGKQAALDAEQAEQARFDKKLAQEEVWIRKGIKARRTRNEGRVRALEKMRRQRSQRREQIGKAKLELSEAERSGKLVVKAKNVSYAYGSETYIRDLNTIILRGDKVGIIGPNGCGKSTLLKLLLGELTPKQGEIKQGTRLEVAYFDQHRAQLDENQTVSDSVANGSQHVTVKGQQRHIISYLSDFLFSPDRARSPVKSLSGGERNRLLLARLFLKPANMLVMDEPTNDLDTETLELLEELLLDFGGTLLLVSHDRAFINNVVTSTLVFEQDGRIGDYAGGYDDWLQQRPQPETPQSTPKKSQKKSKRPAKGKPKRFGFRQKQALEKLPAEIETLETRQAALTETLADPDLYKQAGDDVSKTQSELETVDAQLEKLYARWEVLEALREEESN